LSSKPMLAAGFARPQAEFGPNRSSCFCLCGLRVSLRMRGVKLFDVHDKPINPGLTRGSLKPLNPFVMIGRHSTSSLTSPVVSFKSRDFRST
jgi:hypothetical protein